MNGYEFHTKVAGVTFDNPDGSSRQEHIRKCKEGDQLFLLHDPENEYDNNAVIVYRSERTWWGNERYGQIGFLGRHVAPQVVEHIEEYGEESALAVITSLAGGTWRKPTRGVNIKVMLVGTSPDKIQEADLDKYYTRLNEDYPMDPNY